MWAAARASWPRTWRGPLASSGHWPPTRARGGAASRRLCPPTRTGHENLMKTCSIVSRWYAAMLTTTMATRTDAAPGPTHLRLAQRGLARAAFRRDATELSVEPIKLDSVLSIRIRISKACSPHTEVSARHAPCRALRLRALRCPVTDSRAVGQLKWKCRSTKTANTPTDAARPVTADERLFALLLRGSIPT